MISASVMKGLIHMFLDPVFYKRFTYIFERITVNHIVNLIIPV